MKSASKMTFWELLKKYKVQIPIIQRDYAQGRDDEKTTALRNSFLGNLIEAIKDENKAIELDFVYGDLENGVFQPLDGQQRLTTLFLLHWYVAFSAGKLSDVKETLSKFTYETRVSSREFCEALVKNGLLDNVKGEKISDKIKDAAWFFLSWDNDPTIKGMLVMLDAIEEKLGKSIDGALWEKLTSEDNPPISFYFTELGKFGLTDDLYIKMNARGKQLTDFENFKARFEKHIEERGFEESVKYEKDKFSFKIDGEWLDLFWNIEAQKDVKKLNENLFRFFKRITVNFYAENNPIGENPNEYKLFDIYEGIYDEANFNNLKKVLNGLVEFSKHEEWSNYKNLFIGFLLCDNKNFQYYRQRVRFYALSCFFIEKEAVNGDNLEHFKRWIRVAENLINNTYIQSPEDYEKAIRSINKLSKNIDSLYNKLQERINIDFFRREQKEEEYIKAGLILDDDSQGWEDAILTMESHSYFAGQIGFILKYANNEAGYDIDKFKSYADKLAILFGNDFGDDNQNLFRRALLTKEDYLLPNTKGRCRQLLFSFKNSLRDKYENWRRVFNHDEKTKVLQGLLDDLNERKDSSKLVEELGSFITDYQKDDWRKAIIEYPWIFDRKSILEENGRIYVLNGTTTRSWHFEVFTHYLYVKLCEHNINKEGTEVKQDIYWGTGAKHLNPYTGKECHIPIENKIQNKYYEIYHKGKQIFQICDGDGKCIEEIGGVQQTIAKIKAMFSNENPQT